MEEICFVQAYPVKTIAGTPVYAKNGDVLLKSTENKADDMEGLKARCIARNVTTSNMMDFSGHLYEIAGKVYLCQVTKRRKPK